MTDYEKLKALLTDFGVGFTEGIVEGGHLGITLEADGKVENKVTGYAFYYTEFVFTKDGAFKEVGIWE
jgi:hypothetical protein